jgi:hypothetical protein
MKQIVAAIAEAVGRIQDLRRRRIERWGIRSHRRKVGMSTS